MTALAQDRKADQYGTPDLPGGPGVTLGALPMEANTTIYGGAMVASNAAGNAVPASSSAALKLWGRCEKQVVNNPGTAGAQYVTFKPGVFALNNSTGGDAIAAANVGQYCYAVDDNTVALTDGGGTRPLAGVIWPFTIDNPTLVQVAIGSVSPYAANSTASPGGSSMFKARGVQYANVPNLASFTVAGDDGITYAQNDVVLLPAQTTASQRGPYVVGPVTTGTAPLTRPDWWVSGAAIQPGQTIQVDGEGTIFEGSEWKALCGKGKIVDTDDPIFYPRVCKGTVTLVAGTITLGSTQGLFLFSTTASAVTVTRNTANTSTATTGGYAAPVASRVAGISGTGAVVINAQVAAGTTNAADISTVDFLVTNW